MSTDCLLANLNASQKAAVSSSARTVAILAGPGSGKTHTLTSRTAWLLQNEGLQPWNIIVATFTVKAAREMKERIGKLIGNGLEAQLILGTFHSIARRYLARYGHLIDIPKDFGIADSSDSLAIIKRIVKRHNLTIDPSKARSRISRQKAKGADASDTKGAARKSIEVQEFEICYIEYEEALKRSNLLDYDDLLLRCVDLLRSYPSCVTNVEAVLIDEFQDTNLVQFDLMRLFASARKRITIVGDPDQSIYGFRSAETKNFKRLLKQYPETVTIPLEENYRSSGSILLCALEVIQQDEGRISKSLMATHSVGTRPVLRRLMSSHIEAQWIIEEIQRCLGLTGELMTFDDIAILLRSASLSRQIETALGKAGIAYRMVGGHRFYDRFEVKTILDYLRVINQPDNNDALARIINVPTRGIGDTTVKSLIEEADQSGKTLWSLILDHIRGIKNAKTKMTSKTEQGLSSFVNLILTAKKKFLEPLASDFSVAAMIEHVVKKVSFEEYLMRIYQDDQEREARLANIQELRNQASDFSDLEAVDSADDEALPEVDGLQQNNDSNPLSKFLANIALASDVKAKDASAPKAQVTISTIHAAKGLEWPIVFIPAAYEGSIPHSRAEDTDEERRLLYVAMTRAKALLYMSCPVQNSQREKTTLSPFLALTSLRPYLSEKGPSFTSSITQSISQILNRPCPPHVHYESLQALNSLEDDRFPLKGDDDNISRGPNWSEGGNPHYTQGQLPPKRERIDREPIDRVPQESWRPNYSTTMSSTEKFSTACLTIKSGFVSAGSHLKVLNEVGINCVVEKTKPVAKKSSNGKLAIPKGTLEQQIPEKGRKNNNRSTEGQGDISAYFGKPKPALASPSRTPSISSVGKETFRTSIPRQVGLQPFQLPSGHNPSLQQTSTISPELAEHRFGSASLRPPKRALPDFDDASVPKKPYFCFSSSPPPPDPATEFEDLASKPLPAAAQAEVTETKTIGLHGVAGGFRAATTMHVTTVSSLSTIPAQRRSLGVRRDVKPWSAGPGKPFIPPSRARLP